MKKLLYSLLVLLVLVPALVWSQAYPGATFVQQSPTRTDGGAGAGYSRTTGATITLASANNQYVYITGIDVSNCAGASNVAAANPTFITTTGLNGSPQYMTGSALTAGLCTSTSFTSFATPLKSATAGTNVTFVLPTFAANETISVNVYYFVAP